MQSVIKLSKEAKGMIQLSLAMLFAGSSVVVGKSLIDDIPVFLLTFCTLLVAFLTLLPMAVKRWSEIRSLTFPQWVSLFFQGLCGIILFRVFTLYGLKHTSAVQTGVIIGTTPAVLTILSIILLGEKPTTAGVAGILCAVCGMIVLNLSGANGDGQGNLFGCFLVFTAVISEALFTIFRKKIAEDVSAITNTSILIFISLILILPFAIWDLIDYQTVPDFYTISGIIYYGIFATVLAYLLWTSGVSKVSGEAAGAASAVMPASSVFLAAVFLNDAVTYQQFMGCALVMSGIVFSTFIGKSNKETGILVKIFNYAQTGIRGITAKFAHIFETLK